LYGDRGRDPEVDRRGVRRPSGLLARSATRSSCRNRPRSREGRNRPVELPVRTYHGHPRDNQLELPDAGVSRQRSPRQLTGESRGCLPGALLDWLAKVLPASFRRAKEAESARIKQLTDAATADHALYAALAAEAGRFRSQQHLHFFFSFVCLSALTAIFASGEMKPGMGVSGFLLIVFLLTMVVFQYSLGLESGKRARPLDLALREVQRNLKLPVID